MSTNAITAGYAAKTETKADEFFVEIVILCLVLVAFPIKNVAYLVPPAFVLVQALLGNAGFMRRLLLWGSLAFTVSALSITIDSMSGKLVNPPGLLFAIVTYGTLAVIVSLRANFTISPAKWKKLRTAVSWFVIFQSVIGLAQFAVSRNPDTVCGTFGLFDFLGGITIAQVYLTFNLFAMIMFLLTDKRDRLANVAIVIGMLASLLAHSGHQTLFFMAALAFVAMLQLRLADVLKLVAALSVIVVLTASISTIDKHDILEWYRKVALEADSPKKMVTISAVEIVSQPKNFLLGTAMGQFGSRAAMISSGEYLSMELPKALVGESEYYRQYMLPPLHEYNAHGEDSAMSQPCYSIMNLFVEMGVPLTFLLLVGVTYQFFRNWQLTRTTDSHARWVGLWANVGLVFFVLCCLIENYLEFPQAIFLPALLYVAAIASTHTGDARSDIRPTRQSTFAARRVLAEGRDG